MTRGERDNIVTHLQGMEPVCQQLASRNVLIFDKDYVDAIIRSPPRSYSSIVTPTLTINHKMKMATTPAEIEDVVRKEYEVRTSKGGKLKGQNETALQADGRPGNGNAGGGQGRGRGRGGGGGSRRGLRQGYRKGAGAYSVTPFTPLQFPSAPAPSNSWKTGPSSISTVAGSTGVTLEETWFISVRFDLSYQGRLV